MSTKQRTEAGLRRKIKAQLREIGVDLEGIEAGDGGAMAHAIHALRAVRKAMAAPPRPDYAPTPERERRSRIAPVTVEHGRGKVLQSIWPVDDCRLGVGLTESEYAAAKRLRAAYDIRNRSVGVVDWSGSSRGSSRMELTERQINAGQEVDFVLAHLTEHERRCCHNFVFEEPVFGGTSVMSWVGWGAYWTGEHRPEKARAYSQAMLRACCARIEVALYRLDRERENARAASRRASA